MAYDSKKWRPALYRGQRLIGIRQHREEPTRFLFDVSLKNTRRRKIVTIESGDYQEAIRLYAEFRADIYEGFFLRPVSFEELFARWIGLKPPGAWRRQLWRMYRNHVRREIGGLNLRDIRPAHIDTVAAAIAHKAPATRKAILGIVAGVLRMARDEKLIKELPVEERHRVTVNRLEQKTLITDAVEKYRRVYAAITECFAALPFWRAVFLLGLYGRRKNEILRLRWEDIGLEDGVYIIRGSHSKIKQDLAFPLPDEVRRALRELSPRRASGWVFPNPATGRPYIDIRRYVAMIREASGWEGFGFHRMRNLTSSALYAAGVDASHLSSLLGHTNPQTLKQYLTMQRIESGKIAEEGARALLDFKLSKTDGDSPSVEYPGTSQPERGRPP